MIIIRYECWISEHSYIIELLSQSNGLTADNRQNIHKSVFFFIRNNEIIKLQRQFDSDSWFQSSPLFLGGLFGLQMLPL